MGATEGHGKDHVPGMGHDRLLPLYDPLHGLPGMPSVHGRCRSGGIRPGHRVLEIGCGAGNLALLAKRLHPGVEVVGLDPEPGGAHPRCPISFERSIGRSVRGQNF